MKQTIFLLAVLAAFTIAASLAPENTVSSAIDSSYKKLWNENGLTPSPISSDEEFVRRMYLDLTGRIPNAEQTLIFLTSKDARKREALIHRLLAGEEYAQYQASLWTNLFLGHQRERFVNRAAFAQWFQQQFADNTPWDEMTREILTAEGSLAENPPLNWYVKHKADAANLADDTARFFLGVQLGCARCHNHPHDPWKLEDFYGVAAFFSGIERDRLGFTERMKFRQLKQRKQMLEKKSEGKKPDRREIAGMLQEATELLRLRHDPTGKITAEVKGEQKTYPAKFLITPVPAHSLSGKREELAGWITSKENPYFAKAFVNRVWAQLLGEGFVDPVDDMSEMNPPSNAELMNFLAADFQSNGYDIKRLFFGIANSRTYQLSSQRRPGARSHLDSGKLVPLNADQLVNSFLISTSIEEPLRRISGDEYEQKREMIYRYHVFLFNNDENQQNKTEYEGTVPQALFLLNGKVTNEAVRPHMGNTISVVLRNFRKSEERIDSLFLCALNRYPRAGEKERLAAYVTGSNDETKAYEDILWALLNSSEFLFNH